MTTGGDLIVAIDGAPVAQRRDVSRLVTDELLPGQTVSFTVLRRGKTRKTLQVTLTDRAPAAG